MTTSSTSAARRPRPAASRRRRCCAAQTGRTGAARRAPASRPKPDLLGLVAGRPEPRVEGALRRPLRARGLRRSPLSSRTPRARERDAGAPDVLPRRHRQAALGAQIQPLHERRPAAPDCLGLARRRSRVSGNVYAFSGNGLLMSLSRDGKLALGAFAGRRVRDVDDARRTRVVADHRRRSADRQRADVQLGRARRRRAPLSVVRQGHAAAPTGSARPKGGRPTRFTRIRSWPTSTACGRSSRAAATAPCTRSRSTPARRSGAGPSASAASTPPR